MARETQSKRGTEGSRPVREDAMSVSTKSQFDRDAEWGNRRIQVREFALEILRSHHGAGILTLGEAVARAKAELGRRPQ